MLGPAYIITTNYLITFNVRHQPLVSTTIATLQYHKMNASAASTHASELSVNELEKLLVTRKAEEASTHNPGAEDMPSEALLLSTPQRESSLMLSNIVASQAGVTDSLSAIVEKGTADDLTTPSRRKATSASPIRCSP